MTQLTINGKTHDVNADPDTPLLWVLREWVGMTGPRPEQPDQGTPDQPPKIARRSDYQPIRERQSAVLGLR